MESLIDTSSRDLRTTCNGSKSYFVQSFITWCTNNYESMEITEVVLQILRNDPIEHVKQWMRDMVQFYFSESIFFLSKQRHWRRKQKYVFKMIFCLIENSSFIHFCRSVQWTPSHQYTPANIHVINEHGCTVEVFTGKLYEMRWTQSEMDDWTVYKPRICTPLEWRDRFIQLLERYLGGKYLRDLCLIVVDYLEWYRPRGSCSFEIVK